MKYYNLESTEGPRLAVEARDGVLTDLTSLNDHITGLDDLVLATSVSGLSLDDVARRILESGEHDTYDLSELLEASRSGEGEVVLDIPFTPGEVWAAGVTYQTSEMERRRESGTPDIYSRVYTAERPEIFFKATPSRCVGPFDLVGIRGDSSWNVPEPELALVVYDGEIIGYTVGNDMTSRDIEGENALYLPQAKVFDMCCAIGPCFVTAESIGDAHNLTVRCAVTRDGREVFRGETSTSQMSRKCAELAEWLYRHNSVPDMTVLLTGTAIVPPPEFTLQEDDRIAVTIEGIGTLENEAVVV